MEKIEKLISEYENKKVIISTEDRVTEWIKRYNKESEY